MDKDTQAYTRRIGREALRLSYTAPTAMERANARYLYEDVVAELRRIRETNQ